MEKVVIIGCGNVGMAYAYALINQKTKVDKIVLIDLDRNKALGEAMDLSHGATFSSSKIAIKAGDYSDCKDAKIVVIAAGAKQEKNEKRLDLINKNTKIFKSIVASVVNSGFEGIFLVASNPVDIMSYVVRKYSNFSSNRVIGSGTILDTARLKFLLSNKLQISSSNIHSYVIGEHGDSEFVIWSKSNAGIVPISHIVSKSDMQIIEDEVKSSAYKIINYKGETSYGIGMCLVRITNSILNDEGAVLAVSAPVEEIYIGMPSVINKDGIKGVMKIALNKEEQEKLEMSKEVIRTAIRNMED